MAGQFRRSASLLCDGGSLCFMLDFKKLRFPGGDDIDVFDARGRPTERRSCLHGRGDQYTANIDLRMPEFAGKLSGECEGNGAV
jgi:hypothetical protein